MKYLINILFVLSLWQLNAQQKSIFDNEAKKDIVVLDLYWTGTYIQPDQMTQSWKSVGMNISFFEDIHFKRSQHIGIGLGGTYSLASIHHNGDLVKDSTFVGNYTNYDFSLLTSAYDWNRISFHTFSFSPEVRLRTVSETNKSFKLYIGSHIGFRFAANNTISIDDVKTKNKIANGLHPLSLMPYIKIGYGDIFIFGSYSPLNLFHPKSNINMRYFQLGVSFTG